MTSTKTRTTKEVIDDHLRLRLEAKLEEDLSQNYAEDVICLSLTGGHRGHDGIRQTASELDSAVPAGSYQYDEVKEEGPVAMLVWSARGDGVRIDDGSDSFIVEDGLIKVQTIHYHVTRE